MKIRNAGLEDLPEILKLYEEGDFLKGGTFTGEYRHTALSCLTFFQYNTGTCIFPDKSRLCRDLAFIRFSQPAVICTGTGSLCGIP